MELSQVYLISQESKIKYYAAVNVVSKGISVIAVDILSVVPYWKTGIVYNTVLPATPLIARLVACAAGMLNVHTPNCILAVPLIVTPYVLAAVLVLFRIQLPIPHCTVPLKVITAPVLASNELLSIVPVESFAWFST
jgi:hypothetical protein